MLKNGFRIYLIIAGLIFLAGCGEENYPDFSSPRATLNTSRKALEKGDIKTYRESLADVSKFNYGLGEEQQLKKIKEKLENSDFKNDILNYEIFEIHEKAMVLSSGLYIDGYIIFEQRVEGGVAKLRVSLLKYKNEWKLLQNKDFILDAERID